jgi:hypothetical protein
MKAVHNYIIFLHSLHFVQYRPSSVYEVYGFLQKKILVVVCATTHAPPAVPYLFIRTELLGFR